MLIFALPLATMSKSRTARKSKKKANNVVHFTIEDAAVQHCMAMGMGADSAIEFCTKEFQKFLAAH